MSDALEGVELTHRPTVASSAGAVVAVLFAAAVAATGSIGGGALAATGGVILAGGLVRGHRSAVDLGGFVAFGGVVVAGLESGYVEPTLVGTVGTVVAWDVGHGAIDLGEQLGQESPTLRLEAVLACSSLLVGLLAATIGYALYVFGPATGPVGALVLFLAAAALLTIGLGMGRERGRSRRRRRSP
ncbi:DUF7519 family protein [Halopiger goleimassiliensis]|uniref:DUF7519 family protein n=1 Tax=Halopiger goleimassiliensis TaxID=1293048 RepID=UPI0006779129|nr:hypothetical protein [Halopiger goleimassiliensis]